MKKGIKFDLPFNTSKLYLKHVLYNGCLLYIPVSREEFKQEMKEKLKKFNVQQAALFNTGPEVA